MSRINKPVVDIFPPVITTFTKHNEVFVSRGHICPYCNGSGNVCGRQTGASECEAEICPICGGAGTLRATVTIQWMAENHTELSL